MAVGKASSMMQRTFKFHNLYFLLDMLVVPWVLRNAECLL